MDTLKQPPTLPPKPWRVGLEAARANVLPGLVVQGLMLAVILVYFYCPGAHGVFVWLAERKASWGFGFSALAGMLAAGVLPELLKVTVLQRFSWRRANGSALLFGMVYFAFHCMGTDAFYRFQTWVFGAGTDWLTILKKTVVDLGVYTAFISTPAYLIVAEWRNQGFRFAGMSRVFTRQFFLEKVVPADIAMLGVWIPLCVIIYALPPLLQIPVYSLALAFWALLLAWMARGDSRDIRD